MLLSLVSFLAGFLLCTSSWVSLDAAAIVPRPRIAEFRNEGWLRELPLLFVENQGQWQTQARFVARRPGFIAWLAEDVVSFRLRKKESGKARSVDVSMRFLGTSGDQCLIGLEEEAGKQHFFYGKDPENWRRNVPVYSKLAYGKLYDGIDLQLRGNGKTLAYDLFLSPRADLGQIRVQCSGIEQLAIAEDGSLLMTTGLGVLRHTPPVSWQESLSGERRLVGCEFLLIDENTFGFVANPLDPSLALVIDPGLEWSTFLGGASDDYAAGIGIHPTTGDVIVAGTTESADFPISPAAFDTSFDGVPPGTNCFVCGDAFVARLSQDGQNLVYSTFLGGTRQEFVYAFDLHDSGEAIVGGETLSDDFPITPGAIDSSLGGVIDGFVTRLSADGSSLVYSTYLGSGNPGVLGFPDQVTALAVNERGVVAATGSCTGDFPITRGAYQKQLGGIPQLADIFLAQIGPTGELLYATYFGGPKNEKAPNTLALDPAGDVVFCGESFTEGFPTTVGAFDTTVNDGWKGYVVRMRLDNSLRPKDQLIFSTFLGGSSVSNYDRLRSVAVEPSRNILVGGFTFSSDFPTTPDAYQKVKKTGFEGFLSRFSPDGKQLLYSTYFGSQSGAVMLKDLEVDSSGFVTVAGDYESYGGILDFPLTAGSYGQSLQGKLDSFVTRFYPDLKTIIYSTFLGGTNDVGAPAEQVHAVALDKTGAATLAGTTMSADHPISAGAFDPTFNGAGAIVPGGGGDVFVSRLDLLPSGVTKYGNSTPACGPLFMGISKIPQAGRNVEFLCSGAPPSSSGVLILGSSPDIVGTQIHHVAVHIDASAPWTSIPANSDPWGGATVPLFVPAGFQGNSFYLQFFWTNTADCGKVGAISATNALEVIVP